MRKGFNARKHKQTKIQGIWMDESSRPGTAGVCVRLLVSTAGSAAAVLAGVWFASAARAVGRGPLEPGTVLLVVVELVLLLTVARCALAGLLTAAVILTRKRSGLAAHIALRMSPKLVRPLVAGLLATGLAAGAGAGSASAATRSPALPAAQWTAPTAAPTTALPIALPIALPTALPTGQVARPEPAAVSTLPAAGWVPAGPPGRLTATADVSVVASAPRRHVEAPGAVVVRRGDCLWSVVARSLGPDASDARVAEQWPRWWAANRSAIGEDPNVLLPGMRLHPPTSLRSSAPATPVVAR